MITNMQPFVTVFLPLSERLGMTGRNSDILHPDVVDWLNNNIGPGTLVSSEWFANSDNHKYQWCYVGKDHDNTRTQLGRLFRFRHSLQAQAFKAVWSDK